MGKKEEQTWSASTHADLADFITWPTRLEKENPSASWGVTTLSHGLGLHFHGDGTSVGIIAAFS